MITDTVNFGLVPQLPFGFTSIGRGAGKLDHEKPAKTSKNFLCFSPPSSWEVAMNKEVGIRQMRWVLHPVFVL